MAYNIPQCQSFAKHWPSFSWQSSRRGVGAASVGPKINRRVDEIQEHHILPHHVRNAVDALNSASISRINSTVSCFVVCSELSAVKEHDRQVTVEAESAQLDVRRFDNIYLFKKLVDISTYISSFSWNLRWKNRARTPTCCPSITTCTNFSENAWRRRSTFWRAKKKSGALLLTTSLSK